MASRRIWIALGPLLVASLAAATPARGQQPPDDYRTTARVLAEEADGLFSKGDYAAALDRFERADALVHAPTVGLMAARCLVQLKRWVEASERYVTVTRMELPTTAREVHEQAQRDAEKENAALVPRIPRLVLKVTGGGPALAVTLDGKPVPAALIGASQLVDPGSHHVVARAGQEERAVDVTLAEAERRELPIELPEVATPLPVPAPVPLPPPVPANPPPSEGPSALAVAGWVGVALGGAGVAIGTGLGLAAVSKRSDLSADDKCTADLQCGPEFHDAADAYNALRVGTTPSLVIGGVLLATGITLVAVAPSGSDATERTSFDLRVAPGGLVAAGSF